MPVTDDLRKYRSKLPSKNFCAVQNDEKNHHRHKDQQDNYRSGHFPLLWLVRFLLILAFHDLTELDLLRGNTSVKIFKSPGWDYGYAYLPGWLLSTKLVKKQEGSQLSN